MLFAFLVKYNYFSWYILQSVSIITLITKNLILILFLLLIADSLFKSNKRIYFTFVVYLFFTLFFFANLWYNKYFGNYLSVADMTMGQGIRPIKVLFRQLTGWIDLLFVFEFPVLIYLIFFSGSFKEKSISIFNNSDYRKNKIIVFLLVIILLGGHIIYAGNFYAVDDFFALYEHSTPAFVSVYGITPLYFAEFYSMQTQKKEAVKLADEPEIVGEEELSRDHHIKGVENIIVIQLESFDHKIIGRGHNGKEITPFLNEIKSNSLYFNNIYAQHVNGSFDAEFSFLTSLYPINKNYVFKTNDMTEFNSLVKILKERGYEILGFHGNQGEFFYRDKGYPEMGFDQFYSRDYFSVEEAKVGLDTYLGINDYDFFEQSLQYLEKASSPFFAFYITVTSHTPFDFYPEEYSVKEFDDLKPTIVRDYFNSVHFTDQSLKMFFDGLKEKGMFEDTLFVLYADHTADIHKESYNSGGEFTMEQNLKEPGNIPLMIYHPEIKEQTISKTGTQTDIAPTIFDVLGDDKKPEGFLGVSLLKKEDNPVLFLHEMPQILYHNNLFVRMPQGSEAETEFRRIGYKYESQKENEVPELEKERMVNIINYMQELMKKNITQEE